MGSVDFSNFNDFSMESGVCAGNHTIHFSFPYYVANLK